MHDQGAKAEDTAEDALLHVEAFDLAVIQLGRNTPNEAELDDDSL